MPLRLVTLTVPCPWCLARPGQPCRLDLLRPNPPSADGIHLRRSIPVPPALNGQHIPAGRPGWADTDRKDTE